jgi:hypothetical protein
MLTTGVDEALEEYLAGKAELEQAQANLASQLGQVGYVV